MTTAIMLVEAGLGAAVLPAYIWSFARNREIVSRPLVEPHDPASAWRRFVRSIERILPIAPLL